MTYHGEISDLARVLKCNGDKLLDASCKLSLSSTIIRKLNTSLSHIHRQQKEDTFFQSAPCIADNNNEGVWNLQLLYDFIQKIVALKILPDINIPTDSSVIDLQLFHSLKLLEVNRFSLNLIKGLKCLRSHLEYLTCIRSFSSLSDILEYCGADKCQGYVWMQLKKAVFSHNNLSCLDASLEFIPKLEILDLSHNNLTDAFLINCLPQLNKLNLSYNKLQSAPIFSGSLCNNLRSLCLHSNFIEDVKDLSPLINLRELDLSKNCLLSHSVLAPISCMPYLEWLNLSGNPLSFHPRHRLLTIHYLHPQVTSHFILDYLELNENEKRVVDSSNCIEPTINRSDSFNSQLTYATVINKNYDLKFPSGDVRGNSMKHLNFCPSHSSKSISVISTNSHEEYTTDDMTSNYDSEDSLHFNASLETTINTYVTTDYACSAQNSKSVSTVSISTNEELPISNTTVDRNNSVSGEAIIDTLTDENIHMQDSGFFAATRPISPSQSSIGSAHSLLSNAASELSTLYESDIEVLTNPSQSSIEVLEHYDNDSSDIRLSPS